jgi:hypothetical protein
MRISDLIVKADGLKEMLTVKEQEYFSESDLTNEIVNVDLRASHEWKFKCRYCIE